MPNNNYNQNFIETPDPVSGRQRRTGQNILDLKQTMHERRTLEHMYDPSDAVPQVNQGIHREGSARAFVTVLGGTNPINRPTGEDKNGVEITEHPLTDGDKGRLLVKVGEGLYYWKDATDKWVQVDTTPIGMIQMWSSPLDTPPVSWLKCDGTVTYLIADYPTLGALLGSTYGGNGITTFGVPNMQGISAMGAGSQADYMGTGRTKGSSDPIGTYVEDQIQTLPGEVFFPSSTGPDVHNLAHIVTGIFKKIVGSVNTKVIPQYTGVTSTKGFELDLDEGDVRHGDQGHPSAVLIDYYIKAL